MARVTVEDCVLKVPNRFDLVTLAAQRARDISAGSALTVDRDRDKNPVVALREIADGTIEIETLHEAVITNLQKHGASDSSDEDAENFEIESFVPELAGLGGEAAEAAGDEAEEADETEAVEGEDESDLESLARELASEAGSFRAKDED